MYLCDQCGAVHDLTPTEKEVFYLTCRCGEKLPKLPQYGRNDLILVCPNHSPLFLIGKNVGTYPEILLPVVGNTSTGKSSFLAAWTVFAQERLAFEQSLDVSFPFTGGNRYAKDCVKRFQDGIPPGKTAQTNPLGLGMEMVSRNNRKGIRVYFYDPAGEVFDYNPNSLQPFHYYDYMKGILFLVDPFATPVLRKKYSREYLDAQGFQASDKSIGDGCEKFIRGLYAHNLGRDEYHYASCAVVITKSDVLDLDALIGDVAVRRRMSEDPTLGFEEAMNEVCAEQLKDWGLGHVLRLLDEHFKEVRCFSVSAYGHVPQNGVPFTPERVEMPIMWLLNKCDARLFKLN